MDCYIPVLSLYFDFSASLTTISKCITIYIYYVQSIVFRHGHFLHQHHNQSYLRTSLSSCPFCLLFGFINYSGHNNTWSMKPILVVNFGVHSIISLLIGNWCTACVLKLVIYTTITSVLFWEWIVGLGFELRSSHLQSRCCTIWLIPKVLKK
jgi:hypothetical protein